MTPEDIAAASRALFEAEQGGAQIGILSEAHPKMTMDEAYAVQAGLCALKREAGAQVVGWKIGLTSKAMRDALQIDIPDSGVLFDHMVFENGAEVPKGRFIQPRIEAEIAFVMKDGLSGAVSRDDVLAATDYVAPALEILDTRIIRVNGKSGARRQIVDTISDNAANAGIVMGAPQPADADLRWVGAIVSRDGAVEETGLGAGVLDDPALAVAWLAERLGQYGDRIAPGQIVLSGSFVRPVEAPPGSQIAADFGSFGAVSVRFAGA
jgi:2-oxo-hept-3-ene-1,7-dioate hydratase